MSSRISKSYLSNYVTDFDIKHAVNLVDGLMKIGDYGYTVISVIRVQEVDGLHSVYDDKHLVVACDDKSFAVWDNDGHPDYLGYDEFVKLFAKRLRFDDRFSTLVSVNTFDNDPDLSVQENLAEPQVNRRSWYIEQFLELPKNFGGASGILPPGFYAMENPIVSFDGERVETTGVIVDFNEEDGDAVGTLVSNFDDSGEILSPDSVGWFVGEAGNGFHNIFASWTSEDGESVGGNAIVQFEDGKYSVEAKNRMTGALDYALFVGAVNDRIDDGLPTFIVVQTFSLEDANTIHWLGDTPYEVRGWKVTDGFIQALDADGIREAVKSADEGDFALEHATFVEANSLNLSEVNG